MWPCRSLEVANCDFQTQISLDSIFKSLPFILTMIMHSFALTKWQILCSTLTLPKFILGGYHINCILFKDYYIIILLTIKLRHTLIPIRVKTINAWCPKVYVLPTICNNTILTIITTSTPYFSFWQICFSSPLIIKTIIFPNLS